MKQSKKLALLAFAASLMLGACAQNNQDQSNNQQKGDNMKKTLVVYFSATGNTFIEAHDLSGKVLNVFATSGGSGVEGSAADLKMAYPQYNWDESRLMN